MLAFQFLTIVPLKIAGDVTEGEIAGSAIFFPLVGAFQGLLTAVSALLLMQVFPADITAGLAMLFLVLSNGGFDLDGLADTADGLAVKSSGKAEQDRTKRLLVMKDSATGAMGVIALVMTLLLKYILMQRLLTDFPLPAVLTLFFLMPVLSKWITAPAMYHGTSARKDGLGRIFMEYAGLKSLIKSTVLVFLLAVPVFLLNITGISATGGLVFLIFSMAAFYCFCLLAIIFLTKRFGGLTGDHFGALTEIAEIFFILTGYIWLQHFI
jgi:cobalamin 5'-phosphate synthase/cobalamin synthase